MSDIQSAQVEMGGRDYTVQDTNDSSFRESGDGQRMNIGGKDLYVEDNALKGEATKGQDFSSGKGRKYKQNFFRDVMCYPYTFPFGIINEYIYTLPFCYSTIGQNKAFSTKRKGKKYNDPHYHNPYNTTDDVDHNTKDLKSGVKMDLLINEVSTLIKNNIQTSHVEQSANQFAEVYNEWYDTSKFDNFGNELSEEEYQQKLDKLTSPKKLNMNYPVVSKLLNWENNEYRDLRPFYNKKTGEINNVRPYFCNTNIEQKVSEKIEQISQIDDDIKEKVVNKIKGHIKDHLNEMGVETVPLQASVQSMDKVHNELKNRITETINQSTDQRTTLSSNLKYIDRYGYCDIERDINSPNYGKSKGKLITQESELKTLSKNIIKNSVDIIMKNDVSIEINSNISINRVQNSVIVVSFLINVFFIGILIYLFKMISSKCKEHIPELLEYTKKLGKNINTKQIQKILNHVNCDIEKAMEIISQS